MAAWHGLLGFLTRPAFATASGDAFRFVVGMTVVAALTTVFNYLTVALSAMYLYRSEAAPPTGGRDQLMDIGLAVVMGTAVWFSRAWGPATLSVLIGAPVYGSMMIGAARARAASLALEIAARVDAAEAHGPLPGHSGRVSELVSTLLTKNHPKLDRATLAAWAHGPMSHSYNHRCSGVRYDKHLPTLIRSIPRSRRVEALVPADGIPGSGEISQLIAAACAWDSRRLAGSPIRTPDDLIYTFGIDRALTERVIDLDPGWEMPQLRRPSGTSRRG
jgi:hypothetical protein